MGTGVLMGVEVGTEVGAGVAVGTGVPVGIGVSVAAALITSSGSERVSDWQAPTHTEIKMIGRKNPNRLFPLLLLFVIASVLD